ncbi:YsnF/AvaK domain-containing protein [Desulfitobacterium sp.]|uniref:YsnF/AvaK domain-containing protein n=1 Tax=Desulfitobacterium sp. TaxID=49981 RepID=UPI002B5CF49D|nr:YsnF/AvaK domain-containing protein [Desulfitobacterium sp.]HVJ48864.1 YsnF/AvaK domain-containing protein [Desulfitobacterium sp.]
MTKATQNINAEDMLETSIPIESIYDSKEVTLQIKEEQLNLAKKWMQTGEVKIYRDSFTEEKSFTVPVEREELVIEKKTLASTTQEHIDGPTEVIRIRLSEEQVKFTKHRVALEDVSIYKQEIEDIKHIEETLKKEELKFNLNIKIT